MLLLFWKLPGRLLRLGQHKNLNGIISSGETISAILAYLSIPLFLTQGIIKKEVDLLLISFSGILMFWGLFMLSTHNAHEFNKNNEKDNGNEDGDKKKYSIYTLLNISFIKFLFLSVVIAVIIQSTVDYCLMIVTKEIIKDTKTMASFFGFIFGSAKVFELFLKTTLSNKLLKNYGIQAGIITFALVIGIISLFGLVSHAIGAITFLFIATLLNKIMERSLVRSIYTPTLSVLFQVFTGKMQGLAQNVADGQGKTYGQFIAGFLLFLLSFSHSFTLKIVLINALLIICSLILLYLAKKLLPYYRDELKKRISKTIFNNEPSTFLLNQAMPPDYGTANRDISSKHFSFEKYNPEKSKALALNQDPHDVEELINQLHTRSILKQINPKIQIYWLMIPEVFPYINKKLENDTLDTLEELIKEASIFFNLFQLEKPEANIALHALWIHYISKSSMARSDRPYLKPNEEDRALYSTILSTRRNYSKQTGPKDSLYYHQLKEYLKEYCQILSISQTLDQSSFHYLKLSIKQELNLIIENIFHILSFANDSSTLRSIYSYIYSGENDYQVMALEMLELILEDQEKAWLLPIFQESSNLTILRKLEPFVPVPKRTVNEALTHLSFQHPYRLNIITRYFALSALIKNNEITYMQLAGACFSKEKFICDIACFHLGKLFPHALEDILIRTKKEYPDALAIHNNDELVKKLMPLSLPNRAKSALWHCLDKNLNITNISMYQMTIAHFKAFEKTINDSINHPNPLRVSPT
jgi:hypothetical protein